MDSTAEIITATSTLVAALGSVAATLLAIRNGKKLEEVHKATNGKMEELLKVTKTAAKAEGVLEQKAEAASKNPL